MHNQRHTLFTAALLAAVLLLGAAARTLAVDVPPEHDVYPFLTRLELKGAFDKPLSRSLPYSRRQIGQLLAEAMDDAPRLTPVEQQQLRYYLYLFADALPKEASASRTPMDFEATRGSKLPWKLLRMYGDPRWAWHASGEDWLIGINLHTDIGVESVDSEGSSGTLNRIATGLSVYGTQGPFGLSMAVRDAHLSGDVDLADPHRYPVRFQNEDRSGQGFDFDETDAHVSYEIPHVYAVFGKTTNLWASGATGSLSLSNNSSPYTQLRLKLTYEPFEMTWVQGSLIQDPPITYTVGTDSVHSEELYSEKWIAAHRYEFRVFKKLQIGVYDMVIYGNRGIDWNYLPPTTFLWSAEHYNHDRDNVLMGLDFRLTPGAGLEITANWLLDELKFSDLGSDWYGNKHGYQLGIHAVDPLGWDDSDLDAEVTLLRPYVYTHKYAINVVQHYGSNLGSPLQPNSVQYLLRLRKRPVRQLLLWGQATVTLHGANHDGVNVGGDVLEAFDGETDSETTGLLDGDLERTVSGTLGFEWELDPRLFLRVSAEIGKYELMPVKGEDSSENLRRVDLSLLWHPGRWRPSFFATR